MLNGICPWHWTMGDIYPLDGSHGACLLRGRGPRPCMDLGRDCLLMPCRHLAVCYGCSHLLEECPICRRAVETRIQVYTA